MQEPWALGFKLRAPFLFAAKRSYVESLLPLGVAPAPACRSILENLFFNNKPGRMRGRINPATEGSFVSSVECAEWRRIGQQCGGTHDLLLGPRIFAGGRRRSASASGCETTFDARI
jgi:hypothetical protein